MKPMIATFGLLLASAAWAAQPAQAQYGQSAPAAGSIQQPSQNSQPAAQAAGSERKINISKGAQKAVLALQDAIKAKDAASIPAKIAEAQAAAKTNEDRYYVGVLQMRAGIATQDYAGIAAGIEAILASGSAQPDELPLLHLNLGKAYNNQKQYDKAIPALERAVQLNPNEVEGSIMLAENYNRTGRTADAVRLIQKAIGLRSAAGQKVEESWYKRGVALAYNAQLAAAVPLSRDWAKAYPSPSSWSDSLRIYRRLSTLDDTAKLDALRFARASKSLLADGDYYEYAALADKKGLVGEAKVVLEEGMAAHPNGPNAAALKQLHAVIAAKATGDRESLAASEAKARAAATAAGAITTGDAYYGYGDYAKAIELYRAAQGKSGADANLVNLRLGMALARSGDKAGASAAFNAVTGPRSELAKFWLAYLSTQA